MNWLDWLIILIIALSAFYGLNRGLLASLAGLAGTVLGVFTAYTYYRPLAAYLVANWNAGEKIKPLVIQLFKMWTPSAGPVQSVSQPGRLVSAGGAAAGKAPNIGEYLVNSFTTVVLEALCFLALLFATVWVINLAGIVLTKLAKFTLLGAPNHLGGLLFGTARGLVVVVIILLLLTPFQTLKNQPGTPGANSRRSSAYESSLLLPYFKPLFGVIESLLPNSPAIVLLNPEGPRIS